MEYERYYDQDSNPISFEEWARVFGDTRHRRIGEDHIGDVWVSTVWLGLNHNFGVGPPHIFETMVFGGEHNDYQRRYSTKAQAVAGHDQVVAAIRHGTDPDEGR